MCKARVPSGQAYYNPLAKPFFRYALPQAVAVSRMAQLQGISVTTVQVVENIAASAADVWQILADFGGVRVGGPITAFEIEGEGVGAVRTITMSGGQVIERLDVHDESALNRPSANTSGVTDLYSAASRG